MRRTHVLKRSRGWAVLVLLGLMVLPQGGLARQDAHGAPEGEESESRFSDRPIPLAILPQRPRPLIELGPKFLGTGNINKGFTLPTGAVWTPAFMAFGTLRSAVQTVDNRLADVQLTEAAARFDLFGNLYLTQTERILVGFRPLDQQGRFTRYTLSSSPEIVDEEGNAEGFQDELNFRLQTLFFEGDLAEIFPRLDWDDSRGLDIYFSVGRQALSFQEGLLINEDAMDLVGLTRANMKLSRWVNTRATAVFAWNHIDRPTGAGNPRDSSAVLFGLFTETDGRKRTVELDALFVMADSLGGDGLYLGFSSTRRLKTRFSNAFRVVASTPIGDETPFTRRGVLILEQFGWTPHHSHNWIYVNAFGGFGHFRSAARAPSAGGPLGATGVLFAAVGLGRFGAALGNGGDQSVGGSVGYQMFFGETRKQLVLEAGGRYTHDREFFGQRDAVAVGARYQIAVGRRGVISLDAFSSYDVDSRALPPAFEENSKLSFGGRLELLIQL